MPFNLLGASITWDTEGNGLLDDTTIDYTASPFKLKPEFAMHCIVVEIHETNDLYCFYNGDKIILDGRPYVNEFPDYTVELKNYAPVEYVHMQLDQFPEFIKSVSPKKVVAHNQINYDLLATKLYFGMDYKVGLTGNPELPDEWAGFYTDLVDSMVLSKTLNPDRYGGHSLDALSEKAGLRKIAFRKDIHESVRFKHFAPDMLYYCIVDVKANTQVFTMLEAERLSDGWDWADAISLEKAVADIITRQEHRGFKFDVDLAEANVVELDALMEERRQRIEPILPPKPATKKFMADFTPPKNQFKKDGTVAANLVKFANKIGATIHYNAERESVPEKFEFDGVVYDLPLPIEPLVTEQVATVNDTTHIKDWLVGLGWEPSEYKEKDITKDSKGKVALDAEKYEAAVERYVDQTLSTNFCTHRCEHLGTSPGKLKSMLLKANNGKRGIKVITNPSFTKGQEKEICPNLLLMSEQFPYAKDIVEYLTYKHRRNSILGGGADWDDDEEPEKGYMAYVRADGRVPTPAGTCDAATSRMKHRKVANIPRTTSLYGEKMRALFGVSDNCYQIGYDFDSLEAREEAHYCWPYEEAPHEYCESLLMEKPFDVHTMMAKKISEIIGREFGRSPAKNVKYGCTYGAQAAKVAKTIGSDIETGNVVFEAFWEAAAPLKSLKDRLQAYWERRGGRKFILGIDGRKVPTRSAHAILNSLFQSAGVICAKRAMVIHDRKLREAGLAVDFFMDDWKNMSYFQQLIAYHDEAQGEVTKDLVEFKVFRHSDDEESKDAAKEACKAWKAEAEATTGRVWSDVSHGKCCYYVAYSLPGQLASESVREAGEYYNLRVPLTAGYVVGRNWAECH